ncbi:CEPT1 [Branchiostoma lanceolatum]|uniref:CEPT1 protein n=1 Tax=Branchiostoma lanceolatum TaxID=7740 RepID=A0A8K0A428_BRALA|nr:CEPT1 [Branchiostoma lanceolatum]
MAKKDGQVLSGRQKEALFDHRWYSEGDSILTPYLKPIWYWCGDTAPPSCAFCNMNPRVYLQAPPLLYVLQHESPVSISRRRRSCTFCNMNSRVYLQAPPFPYVLQHESPVSLSRRRRSCTFCNMNSRVYLQAPPFLNAPPFLYVLQHESPCLSPGAAVLCVLQHESPVSISRRRRSCTFCNMNPRVYLQAPPFLRRRSCTFCNMNPRVYLQAPPFLYVLCAAGVLLYQLMDALDGHQGRKVQDTPLEDCFDHSADSVSLVYLTMATCCALQLGTNPFYMLAFCMTASAVFYVLHWNLYATGVFKHLWPFAETETQLAASLVFLTSAAMGPSVWSTQVPLVGVQVKVALVCACLAGGVVTCAQGLWEIFLRLFHNAGKTVQATDVAAPSAILSVILATAVLVPSLLDTPLFLHQPCVFTLVLGTAMAKGNARIIGAYNTFSDAPYVDSCLLVPGLILVMSGLNGVTSGLRDRTGYCDSRLLIALLVIATADLVWYCRALAVDMCDGMGISCFTVNPEKPLIFNTAGLGNNNLKAD